jgi:excisionase family DNA binding protein
MELEKLGFSQKETAYVTGLSVHAVIKHVRLGNIRAVRLGRRVIIPKSEVERLSGVQKEDRA